MEHHSEGSSPSSLESTSPSDVDTEGEGAFEFGYPLHRMVPIETMETRIEDVSTGNRGLYRMSTSQASSTTSHFFYVDFEAVVDEYLSQYDGQEPQDLVFVEAERDESSPDSCRCSLILRCIPIDCEELFILRALNSEDVRSDPWNPAPRLLYVAERDRAAVLCFERLFEYDQLPMQTIANVIDYIRQALEGLSFLHEQKVAHMGYGHPNGVMMDLGRPTAENFDRTRYPVRYYRVNFSQAQRLDPDASLHSYPFRKDVQDCGTMLQSLVDEVPKIGLKLKSLVTAMTGGEYGAEDARRLFDALCKSIDSSIYDAPLSPSPSPSQPPQ